MMLGRSRSEAIDSSSRQLAGVQHRRDPYSHTRASPVYRTRSIDSALEAYGHWAEAER